MSDLIPPAVEIPDTREDDPRIGSLIASPPGNEPSLVLVGFPCDIGVRRNGGRTGSAAAPDAIRTFLYGLTPPAGDHAFLRLLSKTLDLGNLAIGNKLEESQRQLGALLAPYFGRGVVAIVIGGGHETAFGHFLGYVSAELPVQILNWDAHPDVRPLEDGRGHSGSPFRQALLHESELCQGYTVAGLLRHSTAAAHLEFLESHNGAAHFADEMDRDDIARLYAGLSTTTLVSFDLDVLEQTAAPGVSAPAAGGISVDYWLSAVELAGENPRVQSMDLVECNPRFDRDDQTARLAALTIWRFMRGLAHRHQMRSR